MLRIADNQRHPHRRLEKTELLVQSVVAVHLTVVGCIDNNCVVQQLFLFKRLINVPDACIDKRKIAQITRAVGPLAFLAQ